MIESNVIFLDLRGLAMFPQWAVLTQPTFDPATYLAGLQFPDLVGWTTTVQGSIPTLGGTTVHIDQCRMTAFLVDLLRLSR